jgi:purine-nucleoside phosphorylase
MIPTPHIEVADANLFAKTVLMPGDPLRAKFIAENYLTDVVQINHVRNMLGYTGFYKGKRVSVMGSGMGMPSIGIYSFELFSFYGVENIIRVGSCGSYSPRVNVYDVIIVSKAFSESSFAQVAFGENQKLLGADPSLTKKLNASAKKLGYPVLNEIINSSDVFYRKDSGIPKQACDEYGCVAVEMESFALFANADYLKKHAACILTVSDSLVTHQATTSKERQESFQKMMEIALDTAISI